MESYSSHLEPSFVQVNLPPTAINAKVSPSFDLSPSYVTALDNEFTRVYEEYTRRLGGAKATAEDIVSLWAELGTPQAQTDSSIVKYYRDAPEQLGLHQQDIRRLETRREKLLEEKCGREWKLKELRSTVEGLWDRLNVEEADRRRFLASNRGCGIRQINEFEAELDRLNELKRQNLHLFVEDARYKLQELWDSLYFSEEEMLEFTPAFSDVYSDALLSAHEDEIARLEALKGQRAPMLQLIDKHRSLIKDRDDLAASSQDASRLLAKGNKGEKRDPTRLLREEKMRKRIAKDLPKVEVEIKKSLEQWEDEYGRPFLVHGVRYLDELAAAAAKSLPPRSKTPSAPAPSARPAKPTASAAHSRAGSVAGSVARSQPPPRSGAKTPTGTLRYNPMASSVISIATSTASGRTPTKIPARVPLGSMRHGNNSPERRAPAEQAYETSTLRKMAPPARAPPPKMRDLFVPPSATPTAEFNQENIHCGSSASSNESGSVRHITPEDVYDDRERMSYAQYSAMESEQDTPKQYPPQRAQYIPSADSRQISTTSTTTTAASGSENWETFDDASEPEVDAGDAVYAKMRTVKTTTTGKRFAPEGGYPGALGKKPRAIYGNTQTTIHEESGRYVTGSDAGWTDEDAF